MYKKGIHQDATIVIYPVYATPRNLCVNSRAHIKSRSDSFIIPSFLSALSNPSHILIPNNALYLF
jgi:hypothetical protein